MSDIGVRGEQSTSSEITALESIAALAASPSGQFIRKTSLTVFENAASSTLAVTSKTADYTATISDSVILCDTSGGSFTVTLPPSSTSQGITYQIKKIDSSINTVTVDGNASENIDGAITATITAQFASIMIVCDGNSWHII